MSSAAILVSKHPLVGTEQTAVAAPPLPGTCVLRSQVLLPGDHWQKRITARVSTSHEFPLELKPNLLLHVLEPLTRHMLHLSSEAHVATRCPSEHRVRHMSCPTCHSLQAQRAVANVHQPYVELWYSFLAISRNTSAQTTCRLGNESCVSSCDKRCLKAKPQGGRWRSCCVKDGEVGKSVSNLFFSALTQWG